MPKTDKRVDEYIKKSAEFAKPILSHLREMVQIACPEVEETIKWGFPCFEYKGMLCSMASFKNHCAFTFWKASLLKDPEKILHATGETSMGHLGKITSLKDLPSDKILKAYIKEAMKLNEEGIKVPGKSRIKTDKAIEVPEYFIKALKKDKKTFSNFENFSYSWKKEYVDWIAGAKTEDTREKRMETALEWIAEGKHRNWKYMKK